MSRSEILVVEDSPTQARAAAVPARAGRLRRRARRATASPRSSSPASTPPGARADRRRDAADGRLHAVPHAQGRPDAARHAGDPADVALEPAGRDRGPRLRRRQLRPQAVRGRVAAGARRALPGRRAPSAAACPVGRPPRIAAEREQVLDFLFSTFEETVHLDGELTRSYHSLDLLYRLAEGLNRCDDRARGGASRRSPARSSCPACAARGSRSRAGGSRAAPARARACGRSRSAPPPTSASTLRTGQRVLGILQLVGPDERAARRRRAAHAGRRSATRSARRSTARCCRSTSSAACRSARPSCRPRSRRAGAPRRRCARWRRSSSPPTTAWSGSARTGGSRPGTAARRACTATSATRRSGSSIELVVRARPGRRAARDARPRRLGRVDPGLRDGAADPRRHARSRSASRCRRSATPTARSSRSPRSRATSPPARSSSAALLQSQKLESVGRLAGGIAHDFNNLMTGVIGFSRARADAAGRGRPGARLRRGGQALRRARDRAHAAAAGLRPPPDAAARSRSTSTTSSARWDADGAADRPADRARLRARAAAPCPLVADRAQLEQVVMNLAINARDAMDARRAADDRHRVARPSDWVRLTVSDTGSGMDAETQAQIFEPFFTTKEEGKGTGLGLSTVFGIVHQSGGRIAVDSELGAGRRSRSTFRAARTAPPEGADGVAARGDRRRVRVDARGRGRRRRSARSCAACSSRPATRCAWPRRPRRRSPARTPDLLITDILMPGMNGRELADRDPGARAGHARAVHLGLHRRGRRTLEDGARFLAKPFTPERAAGAGPGAARGVTRE